MRLPPPEPAIGEPHPHGEPGDMVADDLWSVPGSAVPVDADQLDGARLGLLRLAGGTPAPGDPQVVGGTPAPDSQVAGGTPAPGDPQADKGRGPGSVGLALLLAVAVLVGLGYLARQLEPSASSGGGGYHNQPGTGADQPGTNADQPADTGAGQAPSTFRTPSDGARSPAPPVQGPGDCPMRLEPAGGVESVGGSARAGGERACFFIG